jgi:uncharacterized damage-inducible protein DinB
MAEKTIQEYNESIQQSLNKIIQTSESLSEETIRLNPSEEEWSILQILSHIKEAIPYWLKEVERVIEAPGTEWGRGLQDAARLEAVVSPNELSVENTLNGVKALKEQVSAVLSSLTDEQLTIESPHRNFAKFGNKPVSFIIGHFIDDHLAGHYGQIQRNLSKVAK